MSHVHGLIGKCTAQRFDKIAEKASCNGFL